MNIKFDKQSIENNENVPIIRLLSEEKVVRIHDAAIEVLEKTGIKIATESARKLLADAGCTVSHGSDIVDALNSQAPWMLRKPPMVLELTKILNTIDFLSCLMYPNYICKNFC